MSHIQDCPVIIIKKNRDTPIRGFHPWIFSGAIEKIPANVLDGTRVIIKSHDSEVLGRGHFFNGSIAVKLFSFGNEEVDENFFDEKLLVAYQLRKELLIDNLTTNCFRLINGEGDFIPGLIIDVYSDCAVIQFHNQGIYNEREFIIKSLLKIQSFNTVFGIRAFDNKKEFYVGNKEYTEVLENNLRFKVNWLKGQKTGFFIDQRRNREILQSFSLNRSILNLFSYTGAFSVYALEGGATNVDSVDVSKEAIQTLEENLNINNLSSKFPSQSHSSVIQDCFEFLKTSTETYDIVIVDPPAFAKHRNALNNALKGYEEINTLALKKVKRGGLLFTFSCSQVVDLHDFRSTIFKAGNNARRTLQIVSNLSQSSCHPINLAHTEGEYLKGFLLRVN